MIHGKRVLFVNLSIRSGTKNLRPRLHMYSTIQAVKTATVPHLDILKMNALINADQSIKQVL